MKNYFVNEKEDKKTWLEQIDKKLNHISKEVCVRTYIKIRQKMIS